MNFDEDKERLRAVLDNLRMTAYRFSKELGYKRPDSIYGVLSGRESISEKMIDRIKRTDIPINIDFLESGYGEPTLEEITKGGFGNELRFQGQVIYPAFLSEKLLCKFGRSLAKNAGLMLELFKIAVTRISQFGINFDYYCYSDTDKELVLNRIVTISICEDWKLISTKEFWNLSTRRLRSKSNMNNAIVKKGVNKAILLIINELQDHKNTGKSLAEMKWCSPLIQQNSSFIVHRSNERIPLYTEKIFVL